MAIEELLKFPHYYEDADDDLKLKINKQIEDNYISMIDWNIIDLHQSSWNKSIDSAYTSLGSDIDNLIDHNNLSTLKSFILSGAKEYLNYCDWNYDEVKIQSSWSVIGTKGSVQGHHTHGDGSTAGGNHISGVYYVSGIPSADAGRLHLQSPHNPLNPETFPFGNKCFMQVWFDARPGRIIMFPAWMTHWVSPIYLEDYKRIAISFNITAENGHPIPMEDRTTWYF
jgi:uncharacterized protein (TIGR02466 family)